MTHSILLCAILVVGFVGIKNTVNGLGCMCGRLLSVNVAYRNGDVGTVNDYGCLATFDYTPVVDPDDTDKMLLRVCRPDQVAYSWMVIPSDFDTQWELLQDYDATKCPIDTCLTYPAISGAPTLAVLGDTKRNIPGSTSQEIIGLVNEENMFFFQSEPQPAVSTTTFASTQLSLVPEIPAAQIINIAHDDARIVTRIKVATLLSLQLDQDYQLVGDFGNGQEVVHHFRLVSQTSPVITSCLNDAVSLRMPPSSNGHYLSIGGRESNMLCRFQIDLSNSNTVNIPMTACDISYEQSFRLSIIQQEDFLVASDFTVEMTCRRFNSLFKLTNGDVTASHVIASNEDVVDFSDSVTASIFLHQRNEPANVISGEADLDTPVSLTIEMDNIYTNTFDIMPLQCTANDKIVLDAGCAYPPLGNFTRTGPGRLVSDFHMFRTVDNGISNPVISFECTLYVCVANDCPSVPCIN